MVSDFHISLILHAFCNENLPLPSLRVGVDFPSPGVSLCPVTCIDQFDVVEVMPEHFEAGL